MTASRRSPINLRAVAVALIGSNVACLALAFLCRAQQNLPLLQITSPAAGTVFNPGQTISVSVTSPAKPRSPQLGLFPRIR